MKKSAQNRPLKTTGDGSTNRKPIPVSELVTQATPEETYQIVSVQARCAYGIAEMLKRFIATGDSLFCEQMERMYDELRGRRNQFGFIEQTLRGMSDNTSFGTTSASHAAFYLAEAIHEAFSTFWQELQGGLPTPDNPRPFSLIDQTRLNDPTYRNLIYLEHQGRLQSLLDSIKFPEKARLLYACEAERDRLANQQNTLAKQESLEQAMNKVLALDNQDTKGNDKVSEHKTPLRLLGKRKNSKWLLFVSILSLYHGYRTARIRILDKPPAKYEELISLSGKKLKKSTLSKHIKTAFGSNRRYRQICLKGDLLKELIRLNGDELSKHKQLQMPDSVADEQDD